MKWLVPIRSCRGRHNCPFHLPLLSSFFSFVLHSSGLCIPTKAWQHSTSIALLRPTRHMAVLAPPIMIFPLLSTATTTTTTVPTFCTTTTLLFSSSSTPSFEPTDNNDDNDNNTNSNENDNQIHQQLQCRHEELQIEKTRQQLEMANTRSFLKRKPRKLPYEDARRWVQANLGCTTAEEYDDLVANGNLRTPYIPKRPEEYYTETREWISWEHFLKGCFDDENPSAVKPWTGVFD